MLCNNNWINVTWDGKPARRKEENLQVDFLIPNGKVLPFDQACNQVANEIASKYNNLVVAFSGGSDSENVCNVLLRNKIPFTPLILYDKSVTDNSLLHEKWFADLWCRQNKIQPLYIDVKDYLQSNRDHSTYKQCLPRLHRGSHTYGILKDFGDQTNSHIITGVQLEYYPDLDQMEYLRPQLGDYCGFVMEESDCYLEVVAPDQHPWAFYYWNATIMASFVSAWNTDLSMQENKSAIYRVSPRPKLFNFVSYDPKFLDLRNKVSKTFGSRDCALLGSKEHLLNKLCS